MTFRQLQDVKRWHVMHRRDHPVEYQMLDLVLTLWVLGLVGEFVGIVLQQPLAVGASLALLLSPTAYVSLRSRLHRTDPANVEAFNAIFGELATLEGQRRSIRDRLRGPAV